MKIAQRVTILLFIGILAALGLAEALLPDQSVSEGERRKLASFPTLTADALFSGDWGEDFETYLLDQFPLRDTWIQIKGFFHTRVLFQKDTDGIFVWEGAVCESQYPLNTDSVNKFSDKLNSLIAGFPEGTPVYYAVIPEKSAYGPLQAGYLVLNPAEVNTLLADRITGARQIDLTGCLTLEDYYRTDIHWRQEWLSGVLETLGEAMSFTLPDTAYTQNTYAPFRGSYASRSPLKTEADTLIYLSSGVTEAATVENLQNPNLNTVYTPEKLEGTDSCDVFLSGATPLLKITNPLAESDRKLVIFRDSFASSLTPLLLPAYSEITLVDLRYMSSQLLEQYVDFTDTEVLFLYNTQVVNNSEMLK